VFDVNFFHEHWPLVESSGARTEGSGEAIDFLRRLQSLRRGMSVEHAENVLGLSPTKVHRGSELGWLGSDEWESRVYYREFEEDARVNGRSIQGAILFYIVAWNGKGGKWVAAVGEPE
jgi:hypothetical protein